MIYAEGAKGIGAGEFRYLFPEYVQKYPEVYDHGNIFWEHAHCDWLEIPIETGATGTLLILAGFIWFAVVLIRNRGFWLPGVFPLLLGCGQTLAHATFDFPFQCPAILISWSALLTMGARWSEMTRNP
jgi:O-antigen ligase